MNSIFHRISDRKFEDRPVERKKKIVQVLKKPGCRRRVRATSNHGSSM